jgi:hypothetical protein
MPEGLAARYRHGANRQCARCARGSGDWARDQHRIAIAVSGLGRSPEAIHGPLYYYLRLTIPVVPQMPSSANGIAIMDLSALPCRPRLGLA